jgi:hypothetical protein
MRRALHGKANQHERSQNADDPLGRWDHQDTDTFAHNDIGVRLLAKANRSF